MPETWLIPANSGERSRARTSDSSMTCGALTLASCMSLALENISSVPPRSRIRPFAMTTILSAKSETTSMSWQTMITAQPRSAILLTVSITVMHSR